jgi:hypothetical protein
MLTDLADFLRKAGLDVVEVSGWKTRGHGVTQVSQSSLKILPETIGSDIGWHRNPANFI